MRTIAFASLLALTSAFGVACGGASPPPAATAADLKAPGAAQIGDKTTCPISGEEFIVSATSPKAEVDGKTYYFCCPHCAEKFRADPAKFLKKTSAPQG
jgi:Cu+-exporting ATPase